jgi:hypothetical protein
VGRLLRVLTSAVVAGALGVATATGATARSPELTWQLATDEPAVVAQSLFGAVTIVPGHDQTRTLTVRNGGDQTGELVVRIVDTTLRTAPSDGFFDEVTVNGVSASRLAAQDATIHTGALAPGESVAVPVRLAFEGNGGNAAVVGEQAFTFAVAMVLTGSATQDDGPAISVETGGVAQRTAPWLLLAGVSLALGVALARRRREDDAA